MNRKDDLIRVIVDSSDASKDKWMPESEAKKLYDASKLLWDLTNRTYCVPR